MSRFSLAEARGLGWTIVHENPNGEGGKPKSIVAEKRLSGPGFPDTLVREEAHSMGLLLERVFAYEAHLKARGYYANAEVTDTPKKRRAKQQPQPDAS